MFPENHESRPKDPPSGGISWEPIEIPQSMEKRVRELETKVAQLERVIEQFERTIDRIAEQDANSTRALERKIREIRNDLPF